MKRRGFLVLIVFALLALALSACAPAAPRWVYPKDSHP